MDNIFNHLHDEHETVATIFEEILNSSESDSQLRDDLFAELEENVIAHARGEEKVFYQRLANQPEMEELINEALREHQEVEVFIKTISQMDSADSAWLEKIQSLQTMIEAHVQREEDVIFPQARKFIEEAEAKTMTERLEQVESYFKSA